MNSAKTAAPEMLTNDLVCDALIVGVRATGLVGRAWAKGGHTRVYIARNSTDLGYVSVDADGCRDYAAVVTTGATSDIEAACEAAVCAADIEGDAAAAAAAAVAKAAAAARARYA